MHWIKRNLFLVVGLVVALALLGGAGYYTYNSFYDNDDQDVALEQLKMELQQFQSGVYPSEENISLIKSNTVLAEAFMRDADRLLAAEPHKPINAAAFSVELARGVDRLRREATNASVELPPKYEFTFGEIKAQSRVLGYAVEPLINQLSEINTLCGVLFKARVRALEGLQRVPAYNADPGGADLLTDLVTRTNVVSPTVSVIITPYRITFRGFVSELTAVLNGLGRTKEFITVRQIDLEAGAAGAAQFAPGMDPATMMNPEMMNIPGGLPGQPGFRPPGFGGALGAGGPLGVASPTMSATPPAPGVPPGRPVQPPRTGFGAGVPPPPKSSLTPILDEKPLRVTLVVDMIKVVRRPVLVAAPPK